MDTMVYVDGFNLYFGSLKNRRDTRWLDLAALSRRLLPANKIVGIAYFTAYVKPRPNDPDQAQGKRQQLYLTALGRLPEVEIFRGVYQEKTKRRPLVRGQDGMTSDWPRTAEFHDTEEKGSDVNLATRLLVDGYNNRYQAAAVICNDGDLKMPVSVVRTELNRPVTIINPDQKGIKSAALSPHKDTPNARYIQLRVSDVQACQFPATITTNSGRTITKPPGW